MHRIYSLNMHPMIETLYDSKELNLCHNLPELPLGSQHFIFSRLYCETIKKVNNM